MNKLYTLRINSNLYDNNKIYTLYMYKLRLKNKQIYNIHTLQHKQIHSSNNDHLVNMWKEDKALCRASSPGGRGCKARLF